MMRWHDETRSYNGPTTFDYVWVLREETTDPSIFIWRNTGDAKGKIQFIVKGHLSEVVEAPDDLDEARALALVLYRMGG